jgi:hypothetical protein
MTGKTELRGTTALRTNVARTDVDSCCAIVILDANSKAIENTADAERKAVVDSRIASKVREMKDFLSVLFGFIPRRVLTIGYR